VVGEMTGGWVDLRAELIKGGETFLWEILRLGLWFLMWIPCKAGAGPSKQSCGRQS
jgi:hypothetical protein